MKIRNAKSEIRGAMVFGLLLALLTIIQQPLTCLGQGTAFTYQGHLNDSGGPANGNYDLRFVIYAVSSGGITVAGPVTNSPVAVSNGQFTVTLDFGTGVFAGADRWLEIAVRTNGGGAFTPLSPRQQLTPTPYAIYAKGASASGITGTLPSSTLFGTYSGPLTFNNGANSFNGSFYGQFFGTSFTGGSFSGDGSGLLNLNASQITEGDFPASSLGNAWRIIGNSNTTPANWIGTSENHALDFRVHNLRGFRIEPDPRDADAANIIGGYISNRIEQPGSGGSAIVGGGFFNGSNIIRSNSSGVFIGAGSVNEAGPNANDVVIAGGFANTVRSSAGAIGGGSYGQIQTNTDYAVIAGGFGNLIQSGSGFSAIGGGYLNQIQTNSGYSVIGGGYQNNIEGQAGQSVIGGGLFNRIQFTADQSVIAGGNANAIFPGARESFIGSGFANQVYSNAYGAVVGGGAYNIASDFGMTTIGGGIGNTNRGYAATVAGGFYNTAANNGAAVGGGGLNVASGFNATVAGGDANQALNQNATIGGGSGNTNFGFSSTIGGGFQNLVSGSYAMVPGGYQNNVAGQLSFAAGRQAKANHGGTFLWADATAADFFSTANNEFAVRASGGVRFVTSGGGFTLNGQPVLTTTSTNALALNNPANAFAGTFAGNGAGLTNLNAWKLDGNSGTTAGANFLGTADNQPLELKVNNTRALRIEPTAGGPNLIGGTAGSAIAPGVEASTIGGGFNNSIASSQSVIAGGNVNNIGPGSIGATIGGGWQNRIHTNAQEATIAGGLQNIIYTNSQLSVIGGGSGNIISNDSFNSVIAGGINNRLGGIQSVVAGGTHNVATGPNSFIGGGGNNSSSIGANVIAGGNFNTNNGAYSVIGGGTSNVVTRDFAVVPGGRNNSADADFTFAAGRRANAEHPGAFVWADSTDANFASTANNQFLIRASGGVGINTNNPAGAALAVNGDIISSGGVNFSDPTKSITFPTVPGSSAAMINMFADGTFNNTRMVIAHSPGFQSYGLQYTDNTDQFDFIGANQPVLSVGLGSLNVGVGTNNPSSKLHVVGNVTTTGFNIVAPTTVAPTAGSTLSPTSGYVTVNPAAPVTLSAVTAIAAGNTPGQMLILRGNSDVNTVTVNDTAGTALGANRVLGLNDTLSLVWSGSAWVELSFSNN